MIYQNINKILFNNSQYCSSNNVKDVERTLRDILRNFHLNKLIDSLLKDKAYLSKLVNLSYSHNLGFDKFVISPYESCNYQLRLHIWWGEYIEKINSWEDVHNHRWDYSTTPIVGSYNYEIYKKDVTGELMYHYHYLPIENGKNALKFVGLDRIKIFKAGTLSKGNIFSTSHKNLHRIIPIHTNKLMVTLFLTTKPKISQVSVYKTDLDNFPFNSIYIPPMNINEFSEKLFLLSNLIDS